MSQDPDPADLLERTASEELLADEGRSLPEAVGRPPSIPPTPTRRHLVAAGATMTGITLLGGIALIVLGTIDALSSGFGSTALVAVILGIVLVSTHWGWVHVAEFTSNAVEGHRNAEIDTERRKWLGMVEPYTRYEVSTDVEDDGALTISTIRHQPVPVGDGQFKFLKEILSPERHSADEPAAVITERAEHLRREAALETEREHTRFLAALEEHERARLGRQDELDQIRARRAASEALAQQINENLKNPPLTE
ncbi:MAG: hypothetical protein ACJ764_02120 [Solirubrobacteraceae bacterium]